MSEPAIREQIKTILSGVSGIGVVHDYQRWATTWQTFLRLFKVEATGKINGWMFGRTTTPERWLTNVEYIRVYEYLIRGVYGLKDKDGTELVFQGLIEAICAAFREDDDLNGTCETINPEFGSLAGKSGIQVDLVENRTFGNSLCHYCELRLGAQVTETRG